MTHYRPEKKLFTSVILCLLLSALSGVYAPEAYCDDAIQPAATLPESMPWDLKALSAAPEHTWLKKEGEVRSLLYQGEAYKGKTTQLFAYYASPATLAGEAPSTKAFPGVVLVHGGGGTAFSDWARLWAERGYAAIAMDLAGCGAERKPLANGGPGQSDETKFGQIDAPVTDQWSYHAVANVIRAHSLLRSFPEVDPNRTALTGISWGGYLTCIVSGLDNRFKASVPIYGCGFLHEGSAWLDQFAQMTPDQSAKWVRLWDPSSYVGSASMPVMFINGTNDFAYWMETYAKTYDLVRGERNLGLKVRMPHGHEVGWAPKEIGLFIDQYLRQGLPLPKLGVPEMTVEAIRVGVESKTALKSAALHFTSDACANPDRRWESVAATIEGESIIAPLPAEKALMWFVTVTDERDASVSTELVFVAK